MGFSQNQMLENVQNTGDFSERKCCPKLDHTARQDRAIPTSDRFLFKIKN